MALKQIEGKNIERPIKVVQFGEGNFLRAFTDYYIQQMNDNNNFSGNVAIVKSIKEGSIDSFRLQNNLYTVMLRGKINNQYIEKSLIIDSIGECIDLYVQYDKYLALSELSSLKFIISNTTEAGIAFRESDKFDDRYDITFPAKLTKFLYNRYLKGLGGLYIIPCELIDNNADALSQCIDKYISLWGLPEEFREWNETKNYYCNSLVDRIVTGFPRSGAEELYNKLGYTDKLLTVAEPFGLWVIEDKGNIREHFNNVNLNKVIFTNDVTPYKLRKVRILNGAHTSMVPVAFLKGFDTVYHTMKDPYMYGYVTGLLSEEVMLTLTLDRKELEEFTEAVIERLENPYVQHMLLSIALNSISKWRVRVLPTMLLYYDKYNKLPKRILMSLACLLRMYLSGRLTEGVMKCNYHGREYILMDDNYVLSFFDSLHSMNDEDKVKAFLSNNELWGMKLTDIDGLYDMVYQLYIDTDNLNGNYE